MASNHTENYGLNQWERTDKVLMEDFNADNAKIDAALTQLQTSALRIHTGGYMGTGASSNTIELPFKPQFFYLQKGMNVETRLMIFGENTVLVRQWDDEPTGMTNHQGGVIDIEEDKIRLTGLDSLTAQNKALYAMNEAGVRYYYMALG